MVDDQDNFKSIDIGIKVSVKKQELAPNDIDDRVKIDLIKLHSEFSKKNLPSSKFNFTYIENEASALASYISRKKISWINALAMAGLSYDHHRGQMNYGQTQTEIRKTFKFLISHIIDLSSGDISVLNDLNMNTANRISLPKELWVSNDHSLCSESRCVIFTITKRSIYAQGRRLFGDWSNALKFCGIDYQKQVIKKISSRSLLDTVLMLNEFDQRKDGKWSFQDIRNENNVLERALHNAFSKKENVPFADFSNQKVAVMVANLYYWREKGELKNDVKWWNEHKDRLLERYHTNHRSQETWSIGKICLKF